MALPDISNLTLAELEELIQTATLRYHSAEASNAATELANRVKITNAIAGLNALLGPEGSAANTNSINGVLAYTDVQMAQNAGLAFRLAFTGLKELTKTVLDVAKVVGKQ